MSDHRILPPALDAEQRETIGRAGRLSYYVAGEGPPLLLVHSINAAGSAYEMRPIFERERAFRRVYAVDLPGFGFSERGDRDYTVRLYVDAIHDMLGVMGGPVDAMALSLGSEFLARAAVEKPAAFSTLSFITPTGFSSTYKGLHGAPGESREIPGLHAAVKFPLWSEGLFTLLTSRRSIRYFLERTWGSKQIDEGMLEYAYLTTHRRGARFAPLAFLSGRLFSRDIQDVYRGLSHPIWMPHATRGDFSDFSAAEWTLGRPNWRREPFETGALPHFEQPARFFAGYDAFRAQASSSESRSPSP